MGEERHCSEAPVNTLMPTLYWEQSQEDIPGLAASLLAEQQAQEVPHSKLVFPK